MRCTCHEGPNAFCYYHTPMDAPIRMREKQERQEREAAIIYMQSPEFERLVREAVERSKAGSASDDR